MLAVLFLSTLLGAAIAQATLPRAFDGQYTHAAANNSLVEWKYFQLIADPVHADSSTPAASFSVLFYQGYAFQFGPRDPTAPEYYLSVAGTFTNGTAFSLTIPAASAQVTAQGQDVTGTWGTVAQFKGSPDHSYQATFTAPEYGLEGTFSMTSVGKRYLHCNTTIDPTFASAIPPGTPLNAAEDFIYNNVWWLTSVPGGRSTLDVRINGSPLRFTGQAYHDANYAPGPFNPVVEQWFSAVGQVGPYDLSFIFLTPINSTKIFTSGYLSRHGTILQNKCSARGIDPDAVSVTPYGGVTDTVTNQLLPAGLILQYTLEHTQQQFVFNFSSSQGTQIVDLPVYHRWIGSVEGGEVGGKMYKGPSAFEWLNSELVPYVPPV